MSFETRYKQLNPAQREAVDWIDGPVLVVAGPGTGKTEILTLRIANILKKTDTAPENILALTFTDSAAVNMRRRLSNLIGSSAYRVVIETFHSFCNNIISDYPEYFPNIIGSTNISEVESIALLEELIISLPLDLLRPWGEPLHYIRDILKKIEEL
jgi:DNA helicase II / ATP-dependent DNA helicase PcrA